VCLKERNVDPSALTQVNCGLSVASHGCPYASENPGLKLRVPVARSRPEERELLSALRLESLLPLATFFVCPVTSLSMGSFALFSRRLGFVRILDDFRVP
jgi:hypothetical protein